MAQPPGWYPDVTMPGFERWWDGGTWSHVTRPVPGTTPAAPTYPPAMSEPSLPQGLSQPPSLPQPPSSETGSVAGTPYAAPQYGTPQSGVGQYGTPQSGVGQYGTPQSGTPQYGTPQYGTPQYGTAPYAGPGRPPGTPYGGYAGGPVTADGAPLASQWARLGAAIIDSLIVGAVGLVLSLPQLRVVWDAYRKLIDEAVSAGSSGPPPDTQAFLNDPELVRALLVASVIGVVVRVIYATVMVALKGATLGKMAVGVRVRSVAADGPVGWGTALLRGAAAHVPNLIPILSYIYPLLDPAWCLWDPQRQCLHDKIARTVVVKTR
jgi:uncharacterized RDD family membrane protein YckC